MTPLFARLLLGLLLAVAAVAPAAAQLAEYRLGPGDKIQVNVFNQPDLSTAAVVGASGDIALPLLGQLKAIGMTVEELQAAIAGRLGETYMVDPRVSIEVVTYRPFFILGEVQKPGKYDYIAGLTVRMAVAVSGGFTRRAREDEVVLVRDSQGEVQRFRASPDALIYPGDTIEVLRRIF